MCGRYFNEEASPQRTAFLEKQRQEALAKAAQLVRPWKGMEEKVETFRVHAFFYDYRGFVDARLTTSDMPGEKKTAGSTAETGGCLTVDVRKEDLEQVLGELCTGPARLSVLVRPVTGDDAKDIAKYGLWFGAALALGPDFLPARPPQRPTLPPKP